MMSLYAAMLADLASGCFRLDLWSKSCVSPYHPEACPRLRVLDNALDSIVLRSTDRHSFDWLNWDMSDMRSIEHSMMMYDVFVMCSESAGTCADTASQLARMILAC